MDTNIGNYENSSESLELQEGAQFNNFAGAGESCASRLDSHSLASQQELVKQHFKTTAHFWDQVYASNDVYGIIHQERRAAVLSMVDGLSLPPGSFVLDAGCGAGSISVAMASRGFSVEAIDHVDEMIDLTRQAARDTGFTSDITVSLGDIHDLSFPGQTFQLALVIGVLPWLSSHRIPLSEIARVLAPGGYVIVNIDNRWALHRLFDPELNFMLMFFKRHIGQMLRRLNLRKTAASAPTTMTSPRKFESLLGECGFDVVRGTIFGFGPFSVFGRRLFPSSFDLKCHRKLQQLCTQGVPVVRSMGAQYLVLARKR